MKAESLALIEQHQTSFSGSKTPVDFLSVRQGIDSVVRDVAAIELSLDTPITITFKDSEFLNFHIEGLQSNVTLVFDTIRGQSLLIEGPSGNLEFKDCIFSDQINVVRSGGSVKFIRGGTDKVFYSSLKKCTFDHTKFNYLIIQFNLMQARSLTVMNADFNLRFSSSDTNVDRNFDDAYFEKCKIKSIEVQCDFNFGNNVYFSDCDFENKISSYESIYRKFKKDFSNHRHENMYNLFGTLELMCHHDELSKKKWSYDYFLSSIYKYLNNFGQDPYRPFKHLLYCTFGAFITGLIVSCSLSTALHDSFLFLLGPFRLLAKDANFKVNNIVYAATFSILGSLLWFFLILGIRKKFKLEK